MQDAVARPPGRPRVHPLPDDRYRLVATRVTIIIQSVGNNEVVCRYATSEDEVTFSIGWLLGHADLQYARKRS